MIVSTVSCAASQQPAPTWLLVSIPIMIGIATIFVVSQLRALKKIENQERDNDTK